MTAPEHGEDTPMIEPNILLEALNHHGVFLKKKAMQIADVTAGFRIHAEEYPTRFEDPNSADFIATRVLQHATVFVVFECKRASPEFNSWCFISHFNQRYRMARELQGQHFRETFTEGGKWVTACSDGYELRRNAQQKFEVRPDAIYKSATQLSSTCLGFCNELWHRNRPGGSSVWLPGANIPAKALHVVIPVLLTTAKLSLVEFNVADININHGTLDQYSVRFSEKPWVLLKHPMASSFETRDKFDFRSVTPPNFPGRDRSMIFAS